jgi:16S rRNA C967 or C1407 C5-methylase (RsmB/RsmF family)
MSNNYEDEVYKFFKQPKNYEMMIQVASHSKKVTDRIIREFWEKLETKLKDKFSEPEWIVKFFPVYGGDHAKLNVFHKDWASDSGERVISVLCAGLHYGNDPSMGIFVSEGLSKDYDLSKIKGALAKKEDLKIQSDTAEWWLKKYPLPFSMRTYSDVNALLSSSNEKFNLVKKTVDDMHKIAIALKKHGAGDIIKKHKNENTPKPQRL